MRAIADIYTTFNTRSETRRAESSELGCKTIHLPRSRPSGDQQLGDGKRLRTGPSGIAIDPTVAGAQVMRCLGQAPNFPEKPLYTHSPTGKKYTRAIFTAASIAHNGCVKPCCAKWIDPASPCRRCPTDGRWPALGMSRQQRSKRSSSRLSRRPPKKRRSQSSHAPPAPPGAADEAMLKSITPPGSDRLQAAADFFESAALREAARMEELPVGWTPERVPALRRSCALGLATLDRVLGGERWRCRRPASLADVDVLAEEASAALRDRAPAADGAGATSGNARPRARRRRSRSPSSSSSSGNKRNKRSDSKSGTQASASAALAPVQMRPRLSTRRGTSLSRLSRGVLDAAARRVQSPYCLTG